MDKNPQKDAKVADTEPVDKNAQKDAKVADKEPRPNGAKTLPEALRSPYVKRVVSLHDRMDKCEDCVSEYMFSAWGSKW